MAEPAASRVLISGHDGTAARLRQVLERNGEAVDLASMPDAARKVVEASAYAIMVVDLLRPDGSGIDFPSSAKAPDGAMPAVVVLSTDPSGRSAAGAAGSPDQRLDGTRLLRSVAAAMHGHGDAMRILHVEDDPDIAAVVTLAFGQEATVAGAASLAEARRRLCGEPFDLVILDVGLPDGSGLDLLEAMAERDLAPIPTIIFSAQEVPERDRRIAAATLIKSRTNLKDLAGTARAVLAAHRHEPVKVAPEPALVEA